MEGGDICISRMERGTGVMTQIQKSELIKDFEGHPISQIACTMSFINIQPPLYDVDFGRQKEGSNGPGQKTLAYLSGQELGGKKKLFTLGLSKGSVVFVGMNNLNTLHTKMSFHRDRIVSV